MLALAGLGAVCLLGCGGDGDQLSAEELVLRADRICREGQARFQEIQAEPPANSKEAVDQTEELIEVAEQELDELDELEPPDGLRDRFDRYLEERGSAIEVLKEGREAAERQDARGYGAAQERAQAQLAARGQLARDLGFKVCSRPSS